MSANGRDYVPGRTTLGRIIFISRPASLLYGMIQCMAEAAHVLISVQLVKHVIVHQNQLFLCFLVQHVDAFECGTMTVRTVLAIKLCALLMALDHSLALSHCAPPSSTIFAPFKWEPAREHRYTTVPAMSSALPKRRFGTAWASA